MKQSSLILVIGVFCGSIPTIGWYEWWEMKHENTLLKENAILERRNVEIVTEYQDLLTGVSNWYRSNPVRVRVQGNKECPGGFDADPGSVTVTVGGVKRDNGSPVGE